MLLIYLLNIGTIHILKFTKIIKQILETDWLLNASLNYDISDDFSLLGRVGRDGYTMKAEERRAVGSVAAIFGLNDVDHHQDTHCLIITFLKLITTF